MSDAIPIFLFVLSFSLCALPPPASAGSAGTAAAQFLSLGAGARALGMGEAYGPVADGAEAIYWNPAGLALLDRGDLAYSHAEMLSYFHHDFLAYATPVSALGGALGASATLFYQDSLSKVTNAGQTAGSFQPMSGSFSLAYARAFLGGDSGAPPSAELPARSDDVLLPDAPGDADMSSPYKPEDGFIRSAAREPSAGGLYAGLAVKYVTETLADRSANAVAADGGALYRPAGLPDLSVSLAFRNAGTRERFIHEAESLPAEIDVGAAYAFRFENERRLLPVAEAAAPLYGEPYAKLGLEYSAAITGSARGAIRAGYKSLSASGLGAVSGLTGGLGATFGRLSVDFGFEPMSSLGEVYRVGFNVGF